MLTPIYAIYGAGGCGRGIMPSARAMLIAQGVPTSRLVFIDDKPNAQQVNGQRVHSYDEFLALEAAARYAVVGIAGGAVREELAARLAEDGVIAWSTQAVNTVIMDGAVIGEGAALSPFVTVGPNVRIGKHFHANLYSYVEHDSVVGDYVTFAPAAKCNGNIVVEDHAYIGAGAVIKQGVPGRPLVIGRGAVVGMGAVVTKSVPAGVTVIGNPARPWIKKC